MVEEAENHEDALKMSGGEAGFGLCFQMMAQQKAAHRQSMMLMQSSEAGLQLQQALDQISTISAALCDIQRLYQDQVRVHVMKESKTGVHSGLFMFSRMSPVSFTPVCR